MITYITAFIFYTLAMVGILLVGFVVYKKTFVMNKSESKGLIKIIDSHMIAPKKTLLIVKIKNEKFLIASDSDRTTFLAKLSDNFDAEDMSDAYVKEEAVKNIIKEMNNSYNDEISFKKQFQEENEKYENLEKSETQKLQKQFMDLYKNNKTSDLKVAKRISGKKEVIQKLLKELNSTGDGIGSKY